MCAINVATKIEHFTRRRSEKNGVNYWRGCKMAKAYFSHSASEEDKEIEKFFEATLKMFGVSIYKIEGDDLLTPPLEKIEDAIKNSDFVFAILTKRHKRLAYGQYGWKASKYIQYEIGIAYAYHKPVIAMAEKGVDVEGILPDITWYHHFRREELAETKAIPSKIIEGLKEMKLHPAVLVALGITLMFFKDLLRAVAGIGVVKKGGDER